MSDARKPDVKSIRCPRCKAEPGKPCSEASGFEFVCIERWRNANFPERPFYGHACIKP